MPSVNVRQLRDSRQLFKWLEPVKWLTQEAQSRCGANCAESPRIQPVEWPDFEARARAIFGDRMIPAVEMLIEDREDRF